MSYGLALNPDDLEAQIADATERGQAGRLLFLLQQRSNPPDRAALITQVKAAAKAHADRVKGKP